MFGKLAKGFGLGDVVDKAEKLTGKDLDGDGKAGGSAAARTASADLGEDAKVPESKCNGNKKALFVGINYFGQKGELRGCINDVVNIKKFVSETFGFKSDAEHMRVLTDDKKDDPSKMPTKANIIAGMKWLVAGAQEGDSLFFHYSGHGGSQKDVSPDTDELDGQDETLIPVDYATAGQIVDDDLHAMLVAGLPKGVRLTAVMDCCHSGSVFDLPYTYTIDGNLEIHETDNRKVAIEAAIAAGQAYFMGDKKKALQKGMEGLMAMLKGPAAKDPAAAERAVHVRTTLADVIQFSGCRDDQTSADAVISNEATGAMSWSLIKAFEEHGVNQTYTELLGNVRKILHGKYTQVPQMSAGHKLKLKDSKFLM